MRHPATHSWPSQTVLFGGGPVGDIVELRVVDPTSGAVRPAPSLRGYRDVRIA